MSGVLSKRLQDIANSVFWEQFKDVKADLWDFTFNKYKKVENSAEERENIVKEKLSKINYPVIEFCEYLLNGVTLEKIDNDTYNFNAGEDFTIKRIYHFGTSLVLSPEISKSYEERCLVESCLREAIKDKHNYDKDVVRDNFSGFLEGDL